jgi:NAD(P)-dependent dehydrogenase (short-subunit alcohol dehydrogenase family)
MPVEFQQMMIENTVAKRLGTPEDIAEVVAFYCSDESHWVTGQTILAVGSYFG